MHTHMLKCLNCGDGSGIRFFDNLCVCVCVYFSFFYQMLLFFCFLNFISFKLNETSITCRGRCKKNGHMEMGEVYEEILFTVHISEQFQMSPRLKHTRSMMWFQETHITPLHLQNKHDNSQALWYRGNRIWVIILGVQTKLVYCTLRYFVDKILKSS